MKPLLRFLVVLSIFFAVNANGQFFLQTSLVNPYGDWAYLIKPGAPCVEVGFDSRLFHGDDIDNRFRIEGSVGYFAVKPTQDTFSTYGISNYNGPVELFPGYEVIQKYHALFVSFKFEYAFTGNKKFSPVLGVSFDFFIMSITTDNYTETIQASNSSDNSEWSASIIPYIALQYKLSQSFLLSAGLGANMAYAGSTDYQTFWKPTIRITYFANQ
jgi:hypothetical protein